MKNGLIVDERGNKRWYKDGKSHREDGPAVEFRDGSKGWFVNGLRHREDGPAIVFTSPTHSGGTKFWFLNDEQLTEDEYANYLLIRWIRDGVNLFDR